jgi:hypothetical protein
MIFILLAPMVLQQVLALRLLGWLLFRYRQ